MNKKNNLPLNSAFLLLLAILNQSCRSGDLGAKRPDHVSVNTGITGWDSGAGAVLATKCANCHSAERSDFVPSNTPTILNGIATIEFFKKEENRGLARAMRTRIESETSDTVMPPRFATPLYDDEKAVVLSFLKMVEDGELSVAPPPTDCIKASSILKNSNRAEDDNDDDNDDDGDDDHNRQHGRSGQVGAGEVPVSNSIDPCSQPDIVPPVATAVKYADIVQIVTTACAGCHDGGRNFSLKTREDLLAVKAAATSAIKTAYMPRNNPTWKDTAAGKLVYQWLLGPKWE